LLTRDFFSIAISVVSPGLFDCLRSTLVQTNGQTTRPLAANLKWLKTNEPVIHRPSTHCNPSFLV
jgi:hypothetical protein